MDRQVLRRWLKAGFLEEHAWFATTEGTPQGGIISPALANWTLDGLQRLLAERFATTPRQQGKSKVHLVRYADDFLITGTSKELLRDQVRPLVAHFLKERGLELSHEKTRITHVEVGFDFLGFHIRRYVSGNDRPKILITPSDKSQQRLKATIKAMTARRRFQDVPRLKFRALNAVLRGWIAYYRHSNAKAIAKNLDFWVNQRLFRWLRQRHRARAGHILTLYQHREKGTRVNLGIQDGETMLFLYKMSDQPLTKYRSRNPPNPYLKIGRAHV